MLIRDSMSSRGRAPARHLKWPRSEPTSSPSSATQPITRKSGSTESGARSVRTTFAWGGPADDVFTTSHAATLETNRTVTPSRGEAVPATRAVCRPCYSDTEMCGARAGFWVSFHTTCKMPKSSNSAWTACSRPSSSACDQFTSTPMRAIRPW